VGQGQTTSRGEGGEICGKLKWTQGAAHQVILGLNCTERAGRKDISESELGSVANESRKRQVKRRMC